MAAAAMGKKAGTANAWAVAAVLALAALLFLTRLGDRTLWSMELRWAQIPREMLQTGCYFRPTINGQVYYDKPLGSYWLVVLAALVRGVCDETAARLPGALAGLLSVGLLMVLARKLYDTATAWRAGLVLATSFSMVFFARHASADLLNLAGVLLALVLFVTNAHRPTGWWLVPFWLVLALTSLTKGLLGFVLPLLIIGVYRSFPSSTSEPGGFFRRQSWLLNAKTLLACPLALVVYLLPFLISAIQHDDHSGLALVYRENLQRFLAPHNHRGPVYLYAGAIWVLLAPWSVLLPAALVRKEAARRKPSGLSDEPEGLRPAASFPASRLFTRVFIWTILIFFTLARSRRSYYLLPILPAGALLTAELLAQPVETLSWLSRRLLRLALAVLLLGVVVCLLAFLPLGSLLPAPWCDLPLPPAAGAGIACCLISLALLGWVWVRMTPGRLTLGLGVSGGLAWFYLFVLAAPEAEVYRDSREFASQVRLHVAEDLDQLALFRTREPVFYLDFPHPLPEFYQPHELDQAIRVQRVRWIVGRQRDLASSGVPGRVLARERSFPWETEAGRQAKLILLECGPTMTE
jgi:4-amino-4-deoxy-L-arabinose transferase-like glycosyltransferase